MDENPGFVDEPAESLLEARFAGANEALRRSLFDQTTRIVRRRRVLRRIAFIGGLAACYLAGLLTVWAGAPRRGGGENVVKAPEMATPGNEVQPPAPAPHGRDAGSDADVPAVALEWQAIDSPAARPDLFRRAGDRYLEQAGDLKSAVRCYRQALKAAPERDLTVSPEDNWLLMALKQAKQKEKHYANSNG